MACRLEVICAHTSFGQEVAVVGAHRELGAWDPSRSLRLQTSQEAFPAWCGDVPPSIIGTEFKFVLLGFNEVEWESIPNRCWSRAQAGLAAEGGALLTTAFNDADLRLRLLPAVCGEMRRRGSAAKPWENSGEEAEGLPAQEDCEPARPSRYTFKPTVSCFEVPQLSENEELKQAIWWQKADFAEFLDARIAIVKAYIQHEKNGTMSSFRDDLISRNESRRGLGLGRREVRLNSTRAYINTVIREQERQRSLGRLDEERLASAARAVSAADLEYSMKNAAADAEVAREYCKEAAVVNGTPTADSPGRLTPGSPTPGLGRMKKVESFGLFQVEEDGDSSLPHMKADAKGFGLSLEELVHHGLRATGRRDASLRQEEPDGAPPP